MVLKSQLLTKFISRVELQIEKYFTEFLEEFNYIPCDSSIDDVIQRQQDVLEENADDAENFKRLQIVKNLKSFKESYEGIGDNYGEGPDYTPLLKLRKSFISEFDDKLFSSS